MSNLILQNRSSLEERNYIRKADPKQNYWFDFSHGVLGRYQMKYGDNFAIVIFGDEDKANDYYAIPFSELSHVFVEDYLSNDKSNVKRRWVGNIIRDGIKITHYPFRIDIGRYRGVEVSQINKLASEMDYFGQTKETLTKTRVDHDKFRASVQENFEFKCALSDISEENLLIASHIIPWSIREDIRLDPGNGILLYSGLDVLFDKGYFSFSDDLSVILSPNYQSFSNELKMILENIKGKRLRKPIIHSINIEYLKWHRDNRLILA